MRYVETKGSDNYEKANFDYHNIVLDDLNDAITLLRYAGCCVKKYFQEENPRPLFYCDETEVSIKENGDVLINGYHENAIGEPSRMCLVCKKEGG